MGIHSRIPVTAGPFADPTPDAAYVIARVPEGAGKMTLVGASAVCDATIAESGTDFVGLRIAKIGAAGTTTPVNVTSLLGGASNGAWTADVPREFTITETDDVNVLAEGEYLKLTYDEGGTVAPGAISVFLELAPGIA
ncbi:MAG: hypothetical protein E6R04_10375 [Spirochaetes bacterium]|nr:MAG: hypothetical protein E6R04_10375 [Spirochaetota bacterium]